MTEKESKRIFFNMVFSAHLHTLGNYCTTLNTLYLNNQAFISDYNNNKDEKLLRIFMDMHEEMKDPEYAETFRNMLVTYSVNTNESHIVLSHFVVVALYSYYERGLKNLLSQTGLCTKEEAKSFYKYGNFKQFFSKKFGMEYEDRTDENFLLLEEIRCINNCIKHSGIVSEDLHSINNKWVEGEEIEDIPDEYISKFVNAPYNYLNSMKDKINNSYFAELSKISI